MYIKRERERYIERERDYCMFYVIACFRESRRNCRFRDSWLRTNGVNTNGAAAKVVNFDGLERKRYYTKLTDV